MKTKRNINNYVKAISRSAIVATLYVVLTYVSAIAGLASGPIQIRLSEALCILPLIFPEAVAGLFVGCILANFLTGAFFYDVLFGSLATLIGALGAYLLRRMPKGLLWISTLPTVLANALIIPAVLILVYDVAQTYWFLLISVAVGELIGATLCGLGLYNILNKHGFIKSLK